MLQPWGKGLIGTSLRYANEVRDAATYFGDLPEIAVPADMLALAFGLLRTLVTAPTSSRLADSDRRWIDRSRWRLMPKHKKSLEVSAYTLPTRPHICLSRPGHVARFCRRGIAVRQSTFLVSLIGLAAFANLLAPAAAQDASVPAWLQPHVGDGDGQISEVVLQRAHMLYRRKVSEGAVRNGCYFAMDATRPNSAESGALSRRFYVICDGDHSFRAISAGHGAGRNLAGLADFSNGRECAKNFGNAEDSELTAGGTYVTAETKTTFKGYYRASANHDAAFSRSFVQFDGEGETANARKRAIGGHASVTLKGVCLRQDPGNPHASPEGYVRFGTLIDYAGGRSNGCTSWSKSDVAQILSIVKDDPTTLYIYPAAADVEAIAQMVASGHSLSHSGLYWNATCLRDIRSPTYWPRERLEPLIARFRAMHPAPPAQSVPLCGDQHKLSVTP